jgi:ankyrin repeat protein
MAPNPDKVVGEHVFLAARMGDAQTVTAWLDESGGVDARCTEFYGTTLLMAAALGGHEATVRMLLRRGASVNLQHSFGRTALMSATFNGHTTIVQALLDAKANASLQDNSGRTALMLAEHHKYTVIAQLLRQHAKRQMAEAEARAAALEARAAALMVHSAAAADAMAAELLGEEAAEKEAAAKKGKGSKKKKAKAAPSAVTADSAAAAPLPGTSRPATVKEGLPAGVSDAALLEAGADSLLQNIRAGTALMMAEQEKHTTVAQLLRQHAKPQAPGRPCDLHPVGGTLSGRRVRIAGLKGRHGRCGVAAYFDAAKVRIGRNSLTVEGEVEAVLLKKPATLQELLEPAPSTLTLIASPNSL